MVANSMLVGICWKKCKKSSPQRSYRPKTFVYSNKSKKLHFSVTISLIAFLACIFCNFSNGFAICIKFCVFWYPLPILHFGFFLLQTFKSTKNVLCNMSYNYILQPSTESQVVKIVVHNTLNRAADLTLMLMMAKAWTVLSIRFSSSFRRLRSL